MVSDNDIDILTRYVAGEASAEEQPALARWIRDDPERERAAAELRVIWENRSKHVDANAAWLRLAAQLDADPAHDAQELTLPRTMPARAPTIPAPYQRSATTKAPPASGGTPGEGQLPRRPLATPFLKAAAVAAVLIGGALTGRALLQDHGGDPDAAPRAMREAAITRPGQLGTLRLPDGTEVVLGVASRLLVDEDYGKNTRIVQLEGDGFFDVEPDPDRAFVVRTAAATAQALGTRFGVTARDADATRVVVAGGRVLVRPAAAESRSEAVVTAGQQAQVRSARDTVDTQPADTARLLAWRHGRLVFENQPLSEVLDQLVYWFDVEFVVTDSALARRRLNGSFDRPTLDNVLEGIAISVNATHRRDGRRVILEPRAQPNPARPRVR